MNIELIEYYLRKRPNSVVGYCYESIMGSTLSASLSVIAKDILIGLYVRDRSKEPTIIIPSVGPHPRYLCRVGSCPFGLVTQQHDKYTREPNPQTIEGLQACLSDKRIIAAAREEAEIIRNIFQSNRSI